ncbi:PI-PLC domain-containing protein [Aspergillus clavatus NRRL 1]|uniref:Tat pathway signal sequence n=1 Tax=Aspergillus clavatus (strain ATCC 1007 / CBS 513.65 / DSM 816 / NCTC 3887 / NRRL 1 / QM 1276 / 107) TaxID=344612 RepID=A1CQF3_ASPCL|nr:uncharacterized protein ACLA_025910 [Aspergillus clavatus NRRL 1]EAW07874.1 conserved hypothetical protein [Aspergillus clavatus NRRL 1]
MRLLNHLLPLLAGGAMLSLAAEESSSTTSTATTTTTTGNNLFTLTGTITDRISDATMPTGKYISYTSTITLPTDSNGKVNSSMVTGSQSLMLTATTTTTTTGNATAQTTSTDSLTRLVGNGGMNATHTASPSASASPVINTQPCNGYPEFCARKYSNITMVAAHNSPFVKRGNAAANQALDVLDQLNDGVRMLQFQTHYENETMYLCHTSCDLLDVGTLTDYFSTVAQWMREHPYDVVTFLIGNFDYVDPGNFSKPIEDSGLSSLVYTPPKIPMALEDWPTLSSMILSGKRAVVFLDYQANQTAYPWLMDEFSQMWETPFSPTDLAFPCTIQRPPGLTPEDAHHRLYMANHNLNVDVSVANLNLLIPNTAQLNQTNAVSGPGSLGWMAGNCTLMWDRPPNFLLVDFYNYGNFNGSVFEVAATMNNVTYDGQCCGTTSAASALVPAKRLVGTLLLIVGVQLLASIF